MRRDHDGGEGGIRTPGAHHSAVFKTAAFNHSATSPARSARLTARHIQMLTRALPRPISIRPSRLPRKHRTRDEWVALKDLAGAGVNSSQGGRRSRSGDNVGARDAAPVSPVGSPVVEQAWARQAVPCPAPTLLLSASSVRSACLCGASPSPSSCRSIARQGRDGGNAIVEPDSDRNADQDGRGQPGDDQTHRAQPPADQHEPERPE